MKQRRSVDSSASIIGGYSAIAQTQLFIQFVEICAALFQWKVSSTFSARWSPSRHPNPPGPFTFPVSSTRAYAHALIEAKINETIRNEGDPIGCVEDGFFVGPRTTAAKRSLLRLLPAILPPEEDDPQTSTRKLAMLYLRCCLTQK
jgi:hypothetical protein